MFADAVSQRLSAVQKSIEPNEVWLIANPTDIQYLTSFVSLLPSEREALLFVSSSKAWLLHASFSPVTRHSAIEYFSGVHPEKMLHYLPNIVEKNEIDVIAIDESHLFVQELRALEKYNSTRPIKIRSNTSKTISEIRMEKDTEETNLLLKAGQITAQAWQDLVPQIIPGMTEKQVCQKLEQLLVSHGSQQPAFPTIVAFGPHSALPHHQPTHTKLAANSAVLVDFGATVEGYRSDMTRTIWVGPKPTPKFLEIETLVQQAYAKALATISQKTAPQARPAKALDIDTAARNYIKAAGYGEQFIHTTGHGVGLDIHEQPSLNWTNTTEIKPGFVITIEPGIYLEGLFGYRYENTISVGNETVVEVTVSQKS